MKDYITDQNQKLNFDLSPTADSSVYENEQAKEIVVGEANRSLVEGYKNELSENEFLVRYEKESGRIFVLGTEDRITYRALRFFFEDLLDSEKGEVTFEGDTTTYIKSDKNILSSFKLNGVNIQEYKVIYPQDADRLTVAAAENIADYFAVNLGTNISVSDDTATASKYEILVGDTNRIEDNISFTLNEGQYTAFSNNNKVVFRGKDYMVGGGFGMLVSENIDTALDLQAVDVTIPSERVAKNYKFAEEYTNTILMIGDGMGYNHIDAAMQNRKELKEFVARYLPYQGSSVTRSQSVLNNADHVTDSAAAGTALATGYKTHNGWLGKNPDGKDVQSVRELAHAYGASTAVVSTDSMTGATPCAFLTHSNNRLITDDLYNQIIKVAENNEIDYLSCTNSDSTVEGILKRDTREALMKISDYGNPFFIMVEEAHIDKHSHSHSFSQMSAVVNRFDEAIAYAIEFTLCHPGTALVITADHETGGIQKVNSIDEVREMMVANGKEEIFNFHQAWIQSDITDMSGYCYTSYEYATTTTLATHTNVDVPVFAVGPGTEIFHNARTENIDIARFIAKAFGAKTFGQTTPVE